MYWELVEPAANWDDGASRLLLETIGRHGFQLEQWDDPRLDMRRGINISRLEGPWVLMPCGIFDAIPLTITRL